MDSNLTYLKEFLDENYLKYNRKNFIDTDPICIPHRYQKKEDIEIAAFFAASLAWGNRKSIINNTNKLMQWMEDAPYDFILNFTKKDLKPFTNFVHRTFNGKDCVFFLEALKRIYTHHKGLELAFKPECEEKTELPLKERILHFRSQFLETNHLTRSEKHLSNPAKKSSSKRLCMFLRWMVRQDKKGVDFGIWKSISPADLCLPLDVHTGNVSRSLGLLNRSQNDWQAVEEITSVLKTFDKADPIKYDFALFGLGVNAALK